MAEFPVRGDRFAFRTVLPDWSDRLMLAVPRDRRVGALQVVELGNQLLTEPQCDLPFPTTATSSWFFLASEDLGVGVPTPSLLTTTLPILRGAPTLTFFRWEDDYWELLDRPASDCDPEEGRIVPRACLLDLGLSLAEAAVMVVEGDGG